MMSAEMMMSESKRREEGWTCRVKESEGGREASSIFPKIQCEMVAIIGIHRVTEVNTLSSIFVTRTISDRNKQSWVYNTYTYGLWYICQYMVFILTVLIFVTKSVRSYMANFLYFKACAHVLRNDINVGKYNFSFTMKIFTQRYNNTHDGVSVSCNV